MNHFFRTVVCEAGEGRDSLEKDERLFQGNPGRGCDKSRSDGVIQNEVVLTRMLHAKFVYPCPHPNPSLTA